MIPEDILIHFGIVITASLCGSFIFTLVFFKGLNRSSEKAKEKAGEWLREVVKNGIADALQDPKVEKVLKDISEAVSPQTNKVMDDILEIVREKLIKEEDKGED